MQTFDLDRLDWRALSDDDDGDGLGDITDDFTDDGDDSDEESW